MVSKKTSGMNSRIAKSKSQERRHAVQREALRVKAYPVLVDAVELGVEWGWSRAHKHGDPEEAQLKNAIAQHVLTEICERFDFGDDRDDL